MLLCGITDQILKLVGNLNVNNIQQIAFDLVMFSLQVPGILIGPVKMAFKSDDIFTFLI